MHEPKDLPLPKSNMNQGPRTVEESKMYIVICIINKKGVECIEIRVWETSSTSQRMNKMLETPDTWNRPVLMTLRRIGNRTILPVRLLIHPSINSTYSCNPSEFCQRQ